MASSSTESSTLLRHIPSSSVVGIRRAEIVKLLCSSHDLFNSMLDKFSDVIDLETRDTIIIHDKAGSSDGANLLLDILCTKLEQSPDYELVIIEIFKGDHDLEQVLQEAGKGSSKQLLPEIDLKLKATGHSVPPNVDSIAMMTTRTMSSAAKKLMSSFHFLLVFLTTIVGQSRIDLDRFTIINLQYLQQDTPRELHIVADLKRCLTSESTCTLDLLKERNLLSYMNFGFLKVIKSIHFKNQLDAYIAEYETFMRSRLRCFAAIFKTDPSLAPPSIHGLHEITVTLVSEWKDKSLLQWKHIMENKVDWSEYLIIKSIHIDHPDHTAAVNITYYVYPFILSRVVQNLTKDVNVIKQFSAVGATFTVHENTIKQAEENSSHVASRIEEALTKLKVIAPTINTEPNEPKETSDYGGYDTKMFLSPPPSKCECPVCFSVPKEPRQMSCCGNTICESCLKRNSDCPYCRKPSESIKDKKLKKEIMKLQVKCPKSIDKLTECYWEGKLGDLEDHQKKDDECPMPKVKMQAIKDKEEMEFRVNAADKKISSQCKNYRSPSMEEKPTAGKTESQENKMIIAPKMEKELEEINDSQKQWIDQPKDQCIYTVDGIEEKTFDWQEKGIFSIHVPAGIVRPGDSCDITVTPVSPVSDCIFPSDSVLVSEVFKVNTSCRILEPIMIRLKHCVKIAEENEVNFLTFVKAENQEGSSPYDFKICEGGSFTVSSQHGTIKSTVFSRFGITWLKRKLHLSYRLDCCVLMLCSLDKEEVHVVITKDLETITEHVRLKSNLKDCEEKHRDKLCVVASEISVQADKENGPWTISPKTSRHSISKETIEDYNGLQAAVPKLTYSLKVKKGCCDPLNNHLFRFGGTDDKDVFEIHFDCSSPYNKGLSNTAHSRRTVENLKRLIKKKFKEHYGNLSEATESCLEEITEKLDERGLIDKGTLSKDLKETTYYDEVMGSFQKLFEFSADDDNVDLINKMEEHCATFFRILEDMEGPAKEASDKMSEELESTVKEELQFEFNISPKSSISGIL